MNIGIPTNIRKNIIDVNNRQHLRQHPWSGLNIIAINSSLNLSGILWTSPKLLGRIVVESSEGSEEWPVDCAPFPVSRVDGKNDWLALSTCFMEFNNVCWIIKRSFQSSANDYIFRDVSSTYIYWITHISWLRLMTLTINRWAMQNQAWCERYIKLEFVIVVFGTDGFEPIGASIEFHFYMVNLDEAEMDSNDYPGQWFTMLTSTHVIYAAPRAEGGPNLYSCTANLTIIQHCVDSDFPEQPDFDKLTWCGGGLPDCDGRQPY